MSEAKILCNPCGVKSMTKVMDDRDELIVSAAWDPIAMPEEDDHVLLVCPRKDKVKNLRAGIIIMVCQECGTDVVVSRSSLWLLGDEARK